MMHLQSKRARSNSALYLKWSKPLFSTLQAGPPAMGTDTSSKNLFCKSGMFVCTCVGRWRNWMEIPHLESGLAMSLRQERSSQHLEPGLSICARPVQQMSTHLKEFKGKNGFESLWAFGIQETPHWWVLSMSSLKDLFCDIWPISDFKKGTPLGLVAIRGGASMFRCRAMGLLSMLLLHSYASYPSSPMSGFHSQSWRWFSLLKRKWKYLTL